MSTHDAAFHEFLVWMRQHGFTWSDHDITFGVHNNTRAVLAKRDLPADYTVCTMPKQGMLTIRTCSIADLLKQHKVRRQMVVSPHALVSSRLSREHLCVHSWVTTAESGLLSP